MTATRATSERRPPAAQTRAHLPDAEGAVERDGVRVCWERHGDGDPAMLLLPAWSIINSRQWKAQVPYLARHYRGGHLRRARQRPVGPAAHRRGLRRRPVRGRRPGRPGRHRHTGGGARRAVAGRPLGGGAGRGPARAGLGRHPDRPGPALHGPAPPRAEQLLRRAARPPRRLGQVQPPLLAARVPGLPGVLRLPGLLRAPLHQAGRGHGGLGAGDEPREPDPHPAGRAAGQPGRDGGGPAPGPLPGAGRPRERGPGAAPRRGGRGRADRRGPGHHRGRRPLPSGPPPGQDQPAHPRVRGVARRDGEMTAVLATGREQTRARYPDAEGFAERDGVRLFWERYGDGETTVFLLPTWSIVHSRFWKTQIPYLARHYRVLTFDGRGNGSDDRTTGAAAYTEVEFAADALAVMDATATRRAVLVSLSCGALWSTVLAADH